MKTKFVLAVLILSFFSCGEKKPPSLFHEIKTLEYSRNTNPLDWQNLFNKSSVLLVQEEILRSAAKTKNPALIPFYKNVLQQHPKPRLLEALFFALSQSDAEEAETILLHLKPDSLPSAALPAYWAALGAGHTLKSFSFLKQEIRQGNHGSDLYRALSIRLKSQPKLHFFPDSIFSANTYLVSSLREYKHLPQIISALPRFSGADQINLLKAVSRSAVADSSRFLKVLYSDSLSFSVLKNVFLKTLSGKASWRAKYYVLKAIPSTQDSVLFAAAFKLTRCRNPQLLVTASESFISSGAKEQTVPFLLEKLHNEKNPYLRGRFLKLLAKAEPQTAFRIIMQDLDKGSDAYKADLLDALARTHLKSAFRTLHQFTQVSNTILANRAFEDLLFVKKVHSSDIKALLRSKAYSSVSIALDQVRTKTMLDINTLLKDYARFSQPDAFEAQRSALKRLSSLSFNPDSNMQKLLWNQAGHPFLQRQLPIYFPQCKWIGFSEKKYLAMLPPFLQPDSLAEHLPNPFVRLETEKGTILLELFADQAPLTTKNFLHLIKKGFYEGLTFHRVVPDFVIQGGDPLADGWGSTSYLIPSEDNSLPFARGSLGIATSGFDTGSCQFFICQSAQPHLDGNYTNFGIVREGISVVDQILPQDKILKISEVEHP